ncbi:MAG TPA: hypothetical protein VF479_00495 [Pseudolysinimonas sp.]
MAAPTKDVATHQSTRAGIALSGGGIRAASFSLGATQALQERLGLIRGPRSAGWISAVSGGAYLASAITLVNAGSRVRYRAKRRGDPDEPTEAADLKDGEWPFSRGSAEAIYMLRRSRYLVEDGAPWLVILLALYVFAFGILTMTGLTVGVGTAAIVAIFAAGSALVPALEQATGLRLQLAPDVQWVGALVALALIALTYLVARVASRIDSHLWRGLLLVLTLPGLVLGALWSVPALIGTLAGIRVTASPAGLGEFAVPIWITVASIAVGSGALLLLSLIPKLRLLRAVVTSVLGIVLIAVPWVLALFGTSWLTVFVTRDWPPSTGQHILVVVGVAVVIAWSVLVTSVTPHRVYASLLSRCFAIVRTDSENGVVARQAGRAKDLLLHSLTPPQAGEPGERYPALLICAAANVSDPGATPAGSNVLPLVMGSDSVRVPTSGTSLSTAELEAVRKAYFPWFWHSSRNSLLSLTSAVAISGAAVSPAMGSMTKNQFRAALAILNIRLGMWLPNPLSERAKTQLDEGRPFMMTPWRLLAEALGLHRISSRLLYASDGGHYENLGLVELLRKQVPELWVVYASADRPGRAPGLVQSIMIAEAELGCMVDLDLDGFAGDLDHKGRPLSSFAHGTVRYRTTGDGEEKTAVIHVMKLGVTATHSSILREYQRRDRTFPYHPTALQIYRAERFEAYRRLGYETTIKALDALPAPARSRRATAAKA